MPIVLDSDFHARHFFAVLFKCLFPSYISSKNVCVLCNYLEAEEWDSLNLFLYSLHDLIVRYSAFKCNSFHTDFCWFFQQVFFFLEYFGILVDVSLLYGTCIVMSVTYLSIHWAFFLFYSYCRMREESFFFNTDTVCSSHLQHMKSEGPNTYSRSHFHVTRTFQLLCNLSGEHSHRADKNNAVLKTAGGVVQPLVITTVLIVQWYFMLTGFYKSTPTFQPQFLDCWDCCNHIVLGFYFIFALFSDFTGYKIRPMLNAFEIPNLPLVLVMLFFSISAVQLRNMYWHCISLE